MTTDAVPKAETATIHVDRMVHHRNVMTGDAMTIVEGLRTNEMVEDRADLRTWVTAEDLRKVMPIADLAAATQNVVLLTADTNHATLARVATAVVNQTKVVDLQLAEARAVSSLGLRGPEADDLRSLAAVLADRRGHRVGVAADHRSAAAHHLAEALPEWDHRGCNAVNHLAVDGRSATADQDVLRWGHRG